MGSDYNREYKLELKIVKDYSKELLKDPKKAREFFVRAGIYTKNGNLTKTYR